MAELVQNGTDFLQSVGWKMDSSNRLVTGGVEDKRRHTRVMEKWGQIQKVGYELVTVINCMPFPLEMHGVVGYFSIREAHIKEGEQFFAYTIDRPKMSTCDEGEGKFTPEPVMPVELGMEFERLYEEYGGVFMIRGSLETMDRAELMTRVVEARTKMMAWMVAQYNLAEDNWQRFNKQPRKLPPHGITAAHFLKQEGTIDGLPEWCHIKKATSGTKPCQHCGETIKEVAKICRFCMLRQDMSLDSQTLAPRPAGAPREENEHEPQTGGLAVQAAPEEEVEPNDLADLDGPDAGASKTYTKPPKADGKKR